MTDIRDATGLTPTQALGIALSTGPMSSEVMDDCQAAAVPMMAHLGAMGFAVVREGELDVERLATLLADSCPSATPCNHRAEGYPYNSGHLAQARELRIALARQPEDQP